MITFSVARRRTAYAMEFGTRECWELDALEPTVIDRLLRDAIASFVSALNVRAADTRPRCQGKNGLGGKNLLCLRKVSGNEMPTSRNRPPSETTVACFFDAPIAGATVASP